MRVFPSATAATAGAAEVQRPVLISQPLADVKPV